MASFGDRIRAFFSKRSNPALLELETWANGRKGLEGFIEPQTATNPVSLLLVDRDGDHLRAPVKDAQDAAAFCSRLAIPVYEAQVIGYPQRMHDFDRRRTSGEVRDLDADIEDLERRLAQDDPNAPDR